ncbi:hypothetical protein PROFUN_02664 [Planoprotostelium fungivorum]|uniref:C2H2-type domain-containing protein n=1 Tax=Planoprotostelium fungivorum TaxID=1890364 RepID=A0A2P6NVC1_9EUKA|nr:hypothetical protein PROFUN_02664 [Planoprotostelium fungivorum]
MEERYSCQHAGCTKSYHDLCDLKRHEMSKHTGERPFKCCDEKFVKKNQLKRHETTHTGLLPYKCDQCDKRFNFPSKVKRHIANVHEINYVCSVEGCTAKFGRYLELRKHITTHKLRAGMTNCPKCDKEIRKTQLSSHLKTHEENRSKFVCNEEGCSKSFSTASNLAQHIKVKHPPDGEVPIFCCEVKGCGKIYQRKGPLTNHMKRHHSGKRPEDDAIAEDGAARQKRPRQVLSETDDSEEEQAALSETDSEEEIEGDSEDEEEEEEVIPKKRKRAPNSRAKPDFDTTVLGAYKKRQKIEPKLKPRYGLIRNLFPFTAERVTSTEPHPFVGEFAPTATPMIMDTYRALCRDRRLYKTRSGDYRIISFVLVFSGSSQKLQVMTNNAAYSVVEEDNVVDGDTPVVELQEVDASTDRGLLIEDNKPIYEEWPLMKKKVGQGSSLGPALVSIAARALTSTEEAGVVFTARGVLYLTGTAAGGFILGGKKSHLIMGIAIVTGGVAFGALTFTMNLWQMLALISIQSFCGAFLEIGANIMMMNLWRADAAPWLQALHFTYGVGAAVGPFIVGLFFEKFEGDDSAMWAFIPIGIVLFTSGFPLLFISTPQGPGEHHSSEEGQGGVKKTNVQYHLMVALMSLYLMLYVGAETSFGGWISIYAIKVYDFEDGTAAFLASAFWTSFTIGRGIAIPLSLKVSSHVMLLSDKVLSLIGLIVLMVFAYLRSVALLWCITILVGLSFASLYPACLVLLPQMGVTITSRSSSQLIIGGAIGDMVTPTLVGILMVRFGSASLLAILIIFVGISVALYLVSYLVIIPRVKEEQMREKNNSLSSSAGDFRWCQLNHISSEPISMTNATAYQPVKEDADLSETSTVELVANEVTDKGLLIDDGKITYLEESPLKKKFITALYCYQFLALGLIGSSLGPALISIAARADIKTEEAGAVFTARGAFYLAGTAVAGFVLGGPRSHLIMGVAIVISGIAFGSISFASKLWQMLVLAAIQSLAASFLEIGSNIMMMNLWRDKAAPWLQALHFNYGVGASIGPFIVALFFERLEGDDSAMWSFLPIGIILVSSGLPLLFIRTPQGPGEDVSDKEVGAGMERKNSNIPYHILVASLSVYLMLYVGAETSLGSWVSLYAIKVYGFSEGSAAFLASAFWTSFTIGRGIAIPLSLKVSSHVMLLSDKMLSLIGLIVLMVFAYLRSVALLWCIVILIGISFASMYPACLVLLPQMGVTMTSRSSSQLIVGGAIGDMVTPTVVGILMVRFEPSSLLAILVIIVGMSVALYVMAYLVLIPRVRRDQIREKTNKGDLM